MGPAFPLIGARNAEQNRSERSPDDTSRRPVKAAAIQSNSPTDSALLARPAAVSERATPDIRVLLVEDSPMDAMRLRQLLSRVRSARMVVESVASVGSAIERIAHGNLDLVLLDLTLPDADGIEGFLSISYTSPALPVVVLTSPATEAQGIEAVRLGAQDCIVKSHVAAGSLCRSIRCALERHHVVASLRAMSLTDELTGLLNRRGFQTMGTGHLKLGNRTGSRFLLFYLDLDDLKVINDTWGHHEGDHAIVRTAEVLRATFRQSDVVARYGGDEFVVLALDSSHDGGAAIRARLEASLARANVEGAGRYCLGLCMGIVAFDAQQDRPLVELMREADRALYREKFTRR
jgi:diguanylate cyclase (GGDEF)-like protein